MNLPKINIPLVFVKIGRYEHLLDLQMNGKMHCKSLHYFSEIEDDGKIRGDVDEITTKFINVSSRNLELYPNGYEEESIKIKINEGILKQRIVEPMGNLFCLYYIDLREIGSGEIYTINEKNNRFGNACLVIFDTEKFIERVKMSLSLLKKEYQMGLVEYFDFKNFEGTFEKSFFQKDLDYAFQKEYRILISNESKDVLNINIGNIQDISVLIEGDIKDFKLKLDSQ